MSDEKVFVDGMIVKRYEKAPDFVICNLSLKGEELVPFMREHQKDGWINVQVKRSKGGKYYAELDTWEPKEQEQAPAPAPAPADSHPDDDIPF